MREILFRGKRADNGEWVYGYFVKQPTGHSRIYWKPFDGSSNNTYHNVKPETVGQYTGLNDRNGVMIFEGDIVLANGHESILVDDFSNCRNFAHIDIRDRYDFIPGIYPFVCSWNDSFSQFNFTSKKYSIACDVSQRAYKLIGNIHENPELLKQGAVCTQE